MGYLGTILELDDGSRLTGVGARPLKPPPPPRVTRQSSRRSNQRGA